MNNTALKTLDGRWPSDQLAVHQASAEDFINIFSTAGRDKLWDDLIINEDDSSLIAQYAADNNYQYNRGPAGLAKQSQGSALIGPARVVNAPIYLHEVRGRVHGYDVTFMLEYAPSTLQTDDADKPLALDKRSFVIVKLPKIFPQIVLDSNKNYPHRIGIMPTSIRSDQKVDLEGDFSDYFDLYAPLGLQLSALTVLAPNFMQILKDSAMMFDVEFYGNELILVTSLSIYEPLVMQKTLDVLQIQLAYFNRLLASWNYDPGALPFDTLKLTAVAGDVMKIGPLRITPVMQTIAILTGFILFGLAILITNR